MSVMNVATLPEFACDEMPAASEPSDCHSRCNRHWKVPGKLYAHFPELPVPSTPVQLFSIHLSSNFRPGYYDFDTGVLALTSGDSLLWN